MAESFKSADTPQTDEGRQYHIGLKPGDVHEYILLCGDVERVEKVAGFFENRTEPVQSREYITISGKYNGIPVTTIATGMGCDNTEIALVELSQIVKNPTFIRVGSSGGLKKGVELGDLVISNGAVRLENTSTNFVVEGYPSFAHHEVVLALLESVKNVNRKWHLGLAATASGFFGTQGRQTPIFKPRFPQIPEEMDNMNVTNFEMEASTLFSMSTLAGYRAGAICAVYANRHAKTFIDAETKIAAEKDCIKVALGAVEILNKMDKKKGESKYWCPSMGL